MSGLGAIIHWRGEPVSNRLMRRMMDVAEHRGPDGVRWQVDGPAGLGHALLAHRKANLEEAPQPVWLPDHSAAVVADCRLDNRDDLERALGRVSWLRGQPSDAELILAAYERWGIELVQRILGDFAFVLWDADRRRVVAARDPFGVRPLFYRWTPRRFLAASEPRQILINPDVSAEIDGLIVGEFLFRRFEDLDRTFFAAVRRLQPAHLLVATDTEVRTTRYWNPEPTAGPVLDSPQDYFDRFRELLTASVRARLSTDFPVAAHLSGGLDSSSVVVLAAEAIGSMASPPPRISALSGLFPGLPCGESIFIRAVEARLPFRVHAFEPAEQPLMSGLKEEIAFINSPFIDLQRGSWACETRVLRETGSRTLLTGLGGDELLHEEYYLRDLALRGRFACLVREAYLGSRYSWNSFGWLLADALKPLVPQPLRDLRRRWVGARGWKAPPWAQPDFVRSFTASPEVPRAETPDFESLIQEWAFRWLNFPGICWALESIEQHASAAGVSVSHPFLDRELAEFVLSIPFDARLPAGRWKTLIRRGLSDRLPALVRDRTRKTSFSSLHLEIMRRNKHALSRELFDAGEWRSSRFVDREAARRDLATLYSTAESEVGRVDSLWRLGVLELWLRSLESRIISQHLPTDTK